MDLKGRQIIAELKECEFSRLDDEGRLREILQRGIKKCGFTLVKMTSHKFNPIGVTLVALISESHVALHTFPEFKHASIDIFHCIDDSEPLFLLLNFIKKELRAKQVEHLNFGRGVVLERV